MSQVTTPVHGDRLWYCVKCDHDSSHHWPFGPIRRNKGSYPKECRVPGCGCRGEITYREPKGEEPKHAIHLQG